MIESDELRSFAGSIDNNYMIWF